MIHMSPLSKQFQPKSAVSPRRNAYMRVQLPLLLGPPRLESLDNVETDLVLSSMTNYITTEVITFVLAVLTAFLLLWILRHTKYSAVSKPVSVNYHFTRKCNKVCGFCFHTEKSSHVATEEEMKRGLKLLKDAGMRKINFAGGEPFLYPKQLAMLCEYCKVDLKLESVSIISNGTKITERWLEKYGQHIDVLGVSCDSFNEDTNIEIGRGTGENVTQLFRI